MDGNPSIGRLAISKLHDIPRTWRNQDSPSYPSTSWVSFYGVETNCYQVSFSQDHGWLNVRCMACKRLIRPFVRPEIHPENIIQWLKNSFVRAWSIKFLYPMLFRSDIRCILYMVLIISELRWTRGNHSGGSITYCPLGLFPPKHWPRRPHPGPEFCPLVEIPLLWHSRMEMLFFVQHSQPVCEMHCSPQPTSISCQTASIHQMPLQHLKLSTDRNFTWPIFFIGIQSSQYLGPALVKNNPNFRALLTWLCKLDFTHSLHARSLDLLQPSSACVELKFWVYLGKVHSDETLRSIDYGRKIASFWPRELIHFTSCVLEPEFLFHWNGPRTAHQYFWNLQPRHLYYKHQMQFHKISRALFPQPSDGSMV